MPCPRMFSNVQERRLLREYESGATAEILAKKSNCSDATIFNIIKRLGGKPRHRSSRKKNATDQQIIRLYRKLKNGNDTARKLHVGESSVYDVLKAHGIEATGRKEYLASIQVFSDKKALSLRRRYETGISALQLAKKHGCSIWAVQKAVQRSGGKIREPGRLSNAEKIRAKKLYESGLNAREVSRKMNHKEHWRVIRFLNKEHPEVVRSRLVGPSGPHWKGGTLIHHGYIYRWVAPDDPMASMRGTTLYVLEHRLVMARKLKRPLLSTETVHHIDGDRTNNDPSNLELRQGRHGRGVAMHCLDCGSRNIGHAKLES